MKRNLLKKNNKDVVDGWMGTYGDMVTLLMAFFVMLYSTADPDPGKYGEIAEAMKETFAASKNKNEFKDLEKNLLDLINRNNLEEQVEIDFSPNGIKINIPGKTLFVSGSAVIIDGMYHIIKDIGLTIGKLLENSTYREYMIEVEGHTDDLPIIKNSEFNSNWDLSSIRATGIVEILFETGIPKNRLAPIGRAETMPMVPNKDAEGNPIPSNRAQNRRVEIYINKYR